MHRIALFRKFGILKVFPDPKKETDIYYLSCIIVKRIIKNPHHLILLKFLRLRTFNYAYINKVSQLRFLFLSVLREIFWSLKILVPQQEKKEEKEKGCSLKYKYIMFDILIIKKPLHINKFNFYSFFTCV